ncbi:hypothetical protein MTBPR1_20150 [Candidatus Terasakiella magnetica]|uniref:Tc1-like transposase DDE domain-containing protein n=1 Tax=Candidatus Terasakiella magnetica TaxID=1867952 RepID=A0A1C3RGI0_9PROT|nr:hypothetical protein MTBPR1_20150 [Candidatus Terasakiella magnetica]
MAEIKEQKAQGKTIEVWFQDEARIGQKNKITRRWAKRGTRPEALQDLRTRSAYIFGAICPEHGKAAGIIMPKCNTFAMEVHLEEISLAVDENAHAIIIMDQAAWHTSSKLKCLITLRLCLCRPNHQSLTLWKTFGSSCDKTGFQIAYSNPMRTL